MHKRGEHKTERVSFFSPKINIYRFLLLRLDIRQWSIVICKNVDATKSVWAINF